MAKEKKVIKQLENFLEEISLEYPINIAYLFGSRARGKPRRDSDIDLLIVSKKFKGKRWLNRSPPLYSKWNLDYPVDFICLTPDEFRERRKQVGIVREAIKSGIKII